VREIVLETVAPFIGDVIVVEAPVLEITNETGIFCGELDAAGSAIVAVAVYVPTARPTGFAMNETELLAPPASEPDAGENVSQDWVLVADQLRLEAPEAAEFFTTTAWFDVDVLPWSAEKLSEVEVVTERMAGFETVTLVVAVEVLFEVSYEMAEMIWVPFE
jgi:hypothetical protein